MSSPPVVRSRSHGRPFARWSLSEIGLNCCTTQTSDEPGVVAVAEREVDQPVRAGERHGGLGALPREQLEPAAGASGEHDDQRADAGHAGWPPAELGGQRLGAVGVEVGEPLLGHRQRVGDSNGVPTTSQSASSSVSLKTWRMLVG